MAEDNDGMMFRMFGAGGGLNRSAKISGVVILGRPL